MVAGETYDGGGGFDTLEVTGTADFSLAGTVVTSIEALKVGTLARFRSNQLQAQTGLVAALAVTGSIGTNTAEVRVDAGATGLALTVDLKDWTFNTWQHSGPDNDRIVIDGSAVVDSTKAQNLTGTIEWDTIKGGAGADVITGLPGLETMFGGAGGDTFVMKAASDFGVVKIISGGTSAAGPAEQGTLDVLRLDAAGIYAFTGSGVTYIDAIRLNANAPGFIVSVGNGLVATSDGDQDGVLGDIRISADIPVVSAVTIDASALTGTNRIVVDGTNLRGGDTITGGAGADQINSGDGADTVRGGGGADIIRGGAAGDLIFGGADNDTLYGDAGDDIIWGGDGTAALSGNDTIYGGIGSDSIHGQDGNDTVYAEGDNDTIYGGAGTDTYDGGTGIDTVDYSFTSAAGPVTVHLGTGTATGTQIGSDTLLSIENVNGGAGNDTITGNGEANVINGNGGNDQVWGHGGNDVIHGNGGNDTLVGGSGVAGNLSGSDTIYGDDGDDRIFGEDGNDFLYDGLGTDVISGGPGDDTIYFQTDSSPDEAWGGDRPRHIRLFSEFWRSGPPRLHIGGLTQ